MSRIIFEDDSVIVIDKPSGLLTMATEKERLRTAYAELRERAAQKRPPERIFIVHRLDREASGLLVFAKTPEAKQRLQDQFKDHSAGRIYLTVVEGRVRSDAFTVRTYLAENAALRVYSIRKGSAGKEAITHVRVLKRGVRTSLLEVKLETGRKHQIRVHLAEMGHPIIGDKVYGRGVTPVRRLALHGAKLQFRHPRSGETMTFETLPSPPFSSLLR